MRKEFAGAFAKLELADEQLDDLRAMLLAHMNRPDVVTGTVEYQPNDRSLVGNLRIQSVPHRAQAVIGNVAHNLRSALDHVARQLVIANGGQPVDPPGSRTQFPIFVDPPGKPLHVRGGVSEAALKIIEAAQPYAADRDTDPPLGVLYHMSNVDKHKEPVPARHAVTGWTTWMGTGTGDPSKPWTAPVKVVDPTEHRVDIVLAVAPPELGDGGCMARYEAMIELSPQGKLGPLPTVAIDLAWQVRRLVDELVATVS